MEHDSDWLSQGMPSGTLTGHRERPKSKRERVRNVMVGY